MSRTLVCELDDGRYNVLVDEDVSTTRLEFNTVLETLKRESELWQVLELCDRHMEKLAQMEAAIESGSRRADDSAMWGNRPPAR